MGRKGKKHEHVNHERWLVSYADFITLLFAFFVVMFSTSQVDGKKLQHFEDAVGVAFHFPPVGGSSGSVLVGGGGGNSMIAPVAGNAARFMRYRLASEAREREEACERLTEALEQDLKQIDPVEGVRVRQVEDGVALELPSEFVFRNGLAALRPGAFETLGVALRRIVEAGGQIRIEVHTRDFPAGGSALTSAWELSAVRAATLANYFQRLGIDPTRLAACGFGGSQPPGAGAPDGAQRVALVFVKP